jgi:hypothetical protein
MLKDLFLSMDDDGSGLLEEPEIKQLAVALGQKLTQNEVAAGAYMHDHSACQHAYASPRQIQHFVRPDFTVLCLAWRCVITSLGF